MGDTTASQRVGSKADPLTVLFKVACESGEIPRPWITLPTVKNHISSRVSVCLFTLRGLAASLCAWSVRIAFLVLGGSRQIMHHVCRTTPSPGVLFLRSFFYSRFDTAVATGIQYMIEHDVHLSCEEPVERLVLLRCD